MGERKMITLQKASKITGIHTRTLKHHIHKGKINAEKKPKKKGDKVRKYNFYYVVDKEEIEDFTPSYYQKVRKTRSECKTCEHNEGYRCEVYVRRNDPIVREGKCYSYEEG